MECSVCERSGDELVDVGVNCASCARTLLYGHRLEHARYLLEKAKLHSQFDAITTGKPEEQRLTEAWNTEIHRTKVNDVRGRLSQSHEAIAALKTEIATLKEETARKKSDLAAEGKELKTTKATLAGSNKGQIDKLHDTMTKGIKGFESMHNASVDMRAYLCRETASLLRLRQRKSRSGDGSQRERYLIAGWIIPDLRTINTVRCTELTAILSCIAHLLSLISFYLGVRLPAEITLPHRNYPLATINTPATSYSGAKIEFPGSGSYLAMTDLSKTNETRNQSRPRPLFIGSDDKNEFVSDVARKDPSAFKFFVEAVSLLAWNISWLIHSQGLAVGSQSWTDACDIGYNMWFLVFAPHQSTALLRALSRRDGHQRPSPGVSRSGTPPADAPVNRLGSYSHASAHSPLTSTSRTIHGKTLRLSQYTMIADPLRKTLENEMKNADWEMLDQDEILDGGENFDEAVLIRTNATDDKHYDDTRSIMTTFTTGRLGQNMNGKPKGTSGWTKVKDMNRDG